MGYWQGAQRFGHSRSHPAIATSPEERHVRGMIEKSVGLLQLIEIKDHLSRSPIYIFGITRGAVRLSLNRRNHIHIVDPEPCLLGQSLVEIRLAFDIIRLGRLPLFVRDLLAQLKVSLLSGLLIKLQWNRAKHGVINMGWRRHHPSLRPEERGETMLQLNGQDLFTTDLGKGQCDDNWR